MCLVQYIKVLYHLVNMFSLGWDGMGWDGWYDNYYGIGDALCNVMYHSDTLIQYKTPYYTMWSKTLFGIEGIRIQCRVTDKRTFIKYEIHKRYKYKWDNKPDYFF